MPSETQPAARIIVLMGVAGCGKSSVGLGLGATEGVPFLDGDDFHPPANVERMSAGTPLTDDDRWPWLDALGKALSVTADVDGRVYAACSALRRAYRDHLTAAAGEPIFFIHLEGSRALIGQRMATRAGHYMPTALLDSQFATLEPPGPGELAKVVSVDAPLEDIIAACRGQARISGG